MYFPPDISVPTRGFPLIAPHRHKSATVNAYLTGCMLKTNASLTALSASLTDTGSVDVNFSIEPRSVNSIASARSLVHKRASGNWVARVEHMEMVLVIVLPLICQTRREQGNTLICK